MVKLCKVLTGHIPFHHAIWPQAAAIVYVDFLPNALLVPHCPAMGVALPSVLVLLVCVSVADVDVPHKRYYCSKASQSCLPLVPGTASQPPPSEGLALKACEVVCAGGSLWPQPRGRSDVNRTLRGIDPCEVHFHWPVTDATPPRLGRLLENATAAFRDTLRRESGGPVPPPHCRAPAPSLVPLLIRLRVKAPTVRLTLATDEAYNLTVGPERCPCGAAEPCWDPGTNICSPRALAERARCGSGIACGAAPDAALMVAVVVAQTYFGARHALETLSQLLPYDESAGHFLLPLTARIEDSPNFAYRGLMIDTARQFLPVPLILDTIRAMSYAKLNTLHWHLSDTASFSVEVPRQPNVTRHGAYGPGLYYSTGDIARVVEHATALGVRVVPELDVPAHAWAGWQWGPAAGLGELVLCGSDWTGDRQVPWSTRGPEPPTGQLNIANPHVHRILADLYLDLVQAFGGPDLFHLGGDEVVVGDPDSISCWNSTTAALAGPNPIVQAIQTSLSHCCPGPPASPPPSQASHTASRTAPEAPAGPCCPDGPNSTRCCPGDITDKHSFYALWTNFTQRASDSLQAAYHALNLSQPSKVLQWGGAGTGGEPAIYNLFGYPKHHLKACPPEKFLVQVWFECVHFACKMTHCAMRSALFGARDHMQAWSTVKTNELATASLKNGWA